MYLLQLEVYPTLVLLLLEIQSPLLGLEKKLLHHLQLQQLVLFMLHFYSM